MNRREAEQLAKPVAAFGLVVDPESRTRVSAVMAGEALGLTRTESRVAVLLAEGRSVPEIAQETGRAEGTVCTHVKNILAKLGLSRQVDLVRLVLSLVDTDGSGN